ncbi:hypothetical protein Ornrh_1290 [Ornithobacterium rhinotracheale DSM 15997]|uniref:Uncharacterized protein n=1 Tax=Ornithobacterium rhinotracheale (strain ATCC 51463 / DSM 15997 / CCUG 23171 / CIP 104009 / LMG 9086) TaxID=867902 RepID=I4A0I8_ORNRL|nr:hypothetical protein Ornrh_1290 [Ornithobacterium rhinotracheale DSM 15997]
MKSQGFCSAIFFGLKTPICDLSKTFVILPSHAKVFGTNILNFNRFCSNGNLGAGGEYFA